MDQQGRAMVEVPRALLEELVKYLPTDEGGSIEVPGNGRWTKQMLSELRSEISGYAGALAAMDLTAEKAGQVVSLDEIEAYAKLPRKQIGSDLGAMTKAVRRLFSVKAWPMRAMQANTGMTYLMQPEIAAWWLS